MIRVIKIVRVFPEDKKSKEEKKEDAVHAVTSA
jgi:hypothetical protein